MRIYPPYNKWKTEIRNPKKFHQFLMENIETNNTNHIAKLKGKLNENGFFVERKLVHNNSARPQIKGVIKTSQNGKQTLTLSIESKKHLLYIVGVFTIIMSFTAISRSTPLMLIGIPIAGVWFYIIGIILFNMELKKTKALLSKIIEKASES